MVTSSKETQPSLFDRPLRFDGATYVRARDDERLTSQYRRIFDLMRDGIWRTLYEIEELTGDPPASISAQLRHMRKPRFGSHTVDRRYLANGLYTYRLVVNARPALRASEGVSVTTPSGSSAGASDAGAPAGGGM